MFLYGMCLNPFFNNPKKHLDSLIALIVHLAISATLLYFGGWKMLLLTQFIPHFIASAIGSYLFYAQHNFPEVKFKGNVEWDYTQAALESSSFMKMNPVLNWITANIGYHHIHHLNSRIPFYRLPEAMRAIPELQQAKVTTLKISDVIACLRLKVWDPGQNKMISLS
jgi:omega-6 fatty acid desaturase (delta-12 desaturase)